MDDCDVRYNFLLRLENTIYLFLLYGVYCFLAYSLDMSRVSKRIDVLPTVTVSEKGINFLCYNLRNQAWFVVFFQLSEVGYEKH